MARYLFYFIFLNLEKKLKNFNEMLVKMPRQQQEHSQICAKSLAFSQRCRSQTRRSLKIKLIKSQKLSSDCCLHYCTAGMSGLIKTFINSTMKAEIWMRRKQKGSCGEARYLRALDFRPTQTAPAWVGRGRADHNGLNAEAENSRFTHLSATG